MTLMNYRITPFIIFLCFVVLATQTQTTNAEDPVIQPTLEQKWNLEEPIFDYEAQQFILTYQFSNYLEGLNDRTFAKLYLYNDKEDPNSPSNCKTIDGDNSYTGPALTLMQDEGIVASSNSTLYETGMQERVTVVMDPLQISQDLQVFSDDNTGNARIDFCIRFGLYTGDYSDPSNFEVNFIETLVTLRVTLTGTFSITDISVAPKDKLRQTAEQSYQLEGFQCTGLDGFGLGVRRNDALPFNQGDVIRVCVQPDQDAREDNVYMREVSFFQYILMEADGVTESSTGQLAIDVDNANAGPFGTMFGLTSINDCRGRTTCIIETILFASFYTGQGKVIGKGSGIMQFGSSVEGGGSSPNRRRLLRGVNPSIRDTGRNLEETNQDVVSEFDVNLSLSDSSQDPFLLARERSGSTRVSNELMFVCVCALASSFLY